MCKKLMYMFFLCWSTDELGNLYADSTIMCNWNFNRVKRGVDCPYSIDVIWNSSRYTSLLAPRRGLWSPFGQFFLFMAGTFSDEDWYAERQAVSKKCCLLSKYKNAGKSLLEVWYVTGFKHVRLLHDNAPAHTSAIVTAFLKKEKVTVLPHPPPRPPSARRF